MATPNDTRSLVTLEEASASYPASLHTLRRMIRTGVLPARMVGRHYIVDAADLDRLFCPIARAPVEGVHRGDGPNAREDRQLRAAGFVPVGGSTHNGGMR